MFVRVWSTMTYFVMVPPPLICVYASMNHNVCQNGRTSIIFNLLKGEKGYMDTHLGSMCMLLKCGTLALGI